jgi:homoserine O-acetyltransferase
MAEHMPQANFVELHSAYGHDGFLVETEKISEHLIPWLTA